MTPFASLTRLAQGVAGPTINGFRRGCSSVDRVLASEAKGRGFDPRQPRQITQRHLDEVAFFVVGKTALPG